MKETPSLKLQNIRLLLFAVYCVICFHFTEIKFYNIKLNEFVSLLTVPFLLVYIKKLNKYIIYFIVFFITILSVTLVLNLTRTFYLDLSGYSILKLPYFISIARFIEFIACLSFATIVCKTTTYYLREGKSYDFILNLVLKANLVFSFIFIFSFVLTYFKITPLDNSLLFYDATPYRTPTIRLRGFYVEGGPLGLMYCFLYILTFFKTGNKWLYQLVFLTIILLAQSKAGLIGVLAWYAYKFYLSFRHTTWLKPIVLVLLIPTFYFVFTKIVFEYIYLLSNFDKILPDRIHDNNFIMGRIAAVIITPNIIFDNPFFGIGLGNYALVRNNPEYLGILPAVKEWDAPGLGVFITLVVENGLVGLMLFLAILYRIYNKYSKVSTESSDLIKLFVLICLLGVQLHFLYIWFLIGLALALPKDKPVPINEISY